MQATVERRRLTAEECAKYNYNQHDQLINKLINQKLKRFNTSDICMDREDIVNICRAHLMKALKDYDPSRGHKLSSYIYMVLDSRIGNMRARFQKKNAQGTISLSDINCWAITGGSDDSDNYGSGSSYSAFESAVKDRSGVEDAFLEKMDVEFVYSKLVGFRKTLFKEFFVDGYTVVEIQDRYPEVGYAKIRREIRALEKIFSTLCEGSVI